MSNIQIKNRLVHLTEGYINKQFANHDDFDQFEISLVNIIIKLLGNIFMCFDVYPSQHESMFSGYNINNIFTRNRGKDDSNGIFTFGCSHGMNHGIYKISIQNKIGGFGMLNTFGITTDIEYFRKNSSFFNDNMKADCYFSNGTLTADLHDDEGVTNQYELFTSWNTKAGDTLTMILDAREKQWTFTYLLNDKKLGKSLNVTPQTYYFFVGSCHHAEDLEYHLTVDVH